VAIGTSAGYTHTAATDGIGGSSSPSYGRMAFRQMARTFSGESFPSSVVRSTMLIASRRPASFDSVLIERRVNEVARSSTITELTVRVGMAPV